jgi:hypothetical protein
MPAFRDLALRAANQLETGAVSAAAFDAGCRSLDVPQAGTDTRFIIDLRADQMNA